MGSEETQGAGYRPPQNSKLKHASIFISQRAGCTINSNAQFCPILSPVYYKASGAIKSIDYCILHLFLIVSWKIPWCRGQNRTKPGTWDDFYYLSWYKKDLRLDFSPKRGPGHKNKGVEVILDQA